MNEAVAFTETEVLLRDGMHNAMFKEQGWPAFLRRPNVFYLSVDLEAKA